MFRLQILHASDLEGGVDAIDNAPNFAAIVDALETQARDQDIASILLSGGDNYIPGPFFNAGGDPSLAPTYEGFYNQFFGLIDVTALAASADANGDGFFDNDEIESQIDAGTVTLEEVYTTDVDGDGNVDFFEEIDTAGGRIDAAIMNALGFDASAIGNHEFDAGTGAFADIINYDSEEGNELSPGRFGAPNVLQEVDTPGIQFPYLSANLDFSQDGDVGALFIDEIRTSDAFRSDLAGARANPDDPGETGPDGRDPKAAPATIVEVDGEPIGVVGATTQLVASISSTGTVDDVSSPGTNDMAALAAVLQPVIDALTAQGVDKIVLASHLQQLALETELAGLLSGVDVILAGGSDSILADGQDRLRAGDAAVGGYPLEVTNADGDPTLIVSTAGEYGYVGRLVVTFDDAGVVVPETVEPEVSGAFATDAEGVLDVTGAASLEAAIAGSEVAREVQGLADAVTGIVTELDGDIAGETAVFLNGLREDVRTQETNLGNLTADANLAAAQTVDPEVAVSIKNGGGIRAPIGEIVDLGGGEVAFTPPAANPVSGKEAGEVSELDIDNALRFDNGLSLVELTPEELVIVLEHGVAATEAGATPGQFPQVGGIQFSFDPAGTAQELGENGAVLVEGERIQSVALLDADGTPEAPFVVDGEVVDGAPETIKVVTLDFLAGGGDGYPFAAFSEVSDLGIGEQQALSDFLRANFPAAGDSPFDQPDLPPGEDTRIQNLDARSDGVGAPVADGAPSASEDLGFSVAAAFVGEGGEGAAEVVAHEDGTLFVTNGALDRIDVFELPAPGADGVVATPDRVLDLAGLEGFDGVQSVAVKNGVVAAAIARAPLETTVFGEEVSLAQPGFVALFDAASGELLSTVDVGNLPDQLTFAPDGKTLLVAGEGEKNEDSANDNNPLGTVAVVDVADPANPVAELLDFTAFNGLEDIARAAGIRIQEGVGFAADVEPEYVAVSPDGTTAFVALQENNAIARIDLATRAIVDVFSLGTVDFAAASRLDPLDDGTIDIRNVEGLVGLRMPDGIASFEADGETYVATANEGDSRGFDEARVGDLLAEGRLDGALVAELEAQGLVDDDPETEIGVERLEVSTIDGDRDGDGDIDLLHTFSSRSFSIFDADGDVVFDSGPAFERIIAEVAPERFNDDEGGTDENRSDAKGPEPEAVTVGEVDGRQYAFIGLERDSGIVIYDVTTPAESFFVNYIPPRFVETTPEGEVARQGPEIVAFIPAEDSTSGNAQIAVAYEISGTTFVYDLVPADASAEASIVINEVLASHTGTDDTEFVELFGTPGASLAGLSLIAVEGDAAGSGEIDSRVDFAEGDVIGANGFYLLGNPAGLAANYGVSPDATIADNFFENSSATYALVETASLADGSVTGDEVVLDAVAATDGDDGDVFFFDAPVIGPDGTFFPAGVRRVEDGVDTDSAADWVIADFFLGDDNTPTAGGTGSTPTTPTATIMAIQGAGHVSPFVLGEGESTAEFFANLPADAFTVTGERVTTSGLVTAIDGNGFYLQDPAGDGDVATSDGLFVFTGDDPAVAVGDAVEVTGTVAEFFPGGTDTRNLPTTELTNPSVTVLSSGNELPDAVILGEDGRVPPDRSIDDDAFAAFEPADDGIDFFESLEGMRVTAADARAVGPTNRFGEIFAVVDDGAGASGLSARGTLNIAPDDFNPEKVQIDVDDDLLPGFDVPQVNVGAGLGDVTGVVSYDFGNFQIQPTEPFAVEAVELEPEATALAGEDDLLTVASYNVLNLDPKVEDVANVADNDPGEVDDDVGDGRFAAIAAQIVDNLNAPDIVALQEVQDNDGAEISEVTAADETLATLVEAIAAAGGPAYAFIDTPDVPTTFVDENGELVRPVGGQPGGDIRNAFLYNPERVELVDGSVRTLTDGDGDVFPFFGGRIPLEATFRFNGEAVTLLNNHLSSKGGSAPILGIEQPFDERQEEATVNGSLDERLEQAAAVAARVAEILAADADANVAVLGDLNEFEFVSPVDEVLGAQLTNLTDTLAEDERYSFIFQGNSQSLDHVLVSEALADGAAFDIVHVNSEFADAPSDHDPLVASLELEADEPDDEPGNEEAPPLLVGDAGPDRLIDTAGTDLLVGGAGRDLLLGLDGDDFMLGGPGSDRMNGGAGDDFLDGGPGRDILFGGEGNDLFALSDGDSFDLIGDFTAGADLLFIGIPDVTREDLRVVDNGPGALLQAQSGEGFETLANLAGGAGLTLDDLLGPEDTLV